MAEKRTVLHWISVTQNPLLLHIWQYMANLTIAVPDEVLKSARKRAFEQGTSVNAVLRDYLGQFAGVTSARQSAAQRILDLSKKARSGRGTGKWTRDDLHER